MDSRADNSTIPASRAGPSKLPGLLLAVVAVLFFAFTQVMIVFKLAQPLCRADWFVEAKTHHVIDFFQFYQVSELAKSNQSHRVYDIDVQKEWHQNLIKPFTDESLDKVFYNQQPPFSYVLLLPLSLLPANYAYIAWCLLQVTFGLTALVLLAGKGALGTAARKRDKFLFALGVLASFPAFVCIWHGNTTFWLVGFLSLYTYCVYSGKDILAGAMLSLSTFKPQYLLVMALPAAAMKKWKVIAALILCETILMLAAIPIIGFENTVFYPQIVAHAESSPKLYGVNDQWMVSIRGLFAQYLSSKQSLMFAAIVMFAGLVPLFLLWRFVLKRLEQSKNQDEKERALAFAWATTIVFSVFSSPHAHVFDWLLISMAAALTMKTLSLRKLGDIPYEERWWCGFLILFPLLGWLANYTLTYKVAPLFFFLPSSAYLLLVAFSIALKACRSLQDDSSSAPSDTAKSAS